MPATLHARSLTVTRGPALVFDQLDLTVAPGMRIGLVGPNGSGKSTLLGALANSVTIDAGSVTLDPPTASIGALAQEPERRVDETALDFLRRRSGVADAEVELTDATDALAAAEAGSDDRYDRALQRWLALGAADLEARIGQVWADLGLAARLLDQPMTSLSGGEAARVGLAALQLSRHDLYLLDEPTNDLDLDGLARLEAWVDETEAGLVVVSHDRTFLANVVTDVLELDEFSHRGTLFGGGWDAYVTERATARQLAQERYDRYDDQRRSLEQRAQRQREWASQGRAKVRKSGETDKHIRNFKIDQTEQLAAKSARTMKALERLEEVDKPYVPWELRFEIASAERSGDVVARLEGATVRRGSFTLGPVDLEIGVGERIAVVGANGSGKSTLVQTLLGRLQPEAGRAHLGPSVVVGEIEQARTQLDSLTEGAAASSRSVYPFGQAFAEAVGWTTTESRSLLAKFGLGAEHVARPASSLSPGERTRAVLALLAARGANLLVLDEPTNHLDLPAIEQLEQALDSFAGTIILVSHDRALLEHVRLTRTLTVRNGTVLDDAVVNKAVLDERPPGDA